MPNPNINSCMFTGNLTADPELKRTQSGKSVATFTIAVNKFYGKEKSVMFLNCVAWDKKAEFLTQWFSKGASVFVAGALEDHPWTNKDGKKIHSLELTCSDIQFCSIKGEAPADVFNGAPNSDNSINDIDNFEELSADDMLPF